MKRTAKVGRPPKFKTKAELAERIEKYFEECESGRRPPTVSGLAYFLGFTSRQGLLYWQGKDEYTPIIERAKLRIESYNEERLYDREGVRGAMFNLANNYSGWSSEKSVNIGLDPVVIVQDLKE